MGLNTGEIALTSTLQYAVAAVGAGLSGYNVPGNLNLHTPYTSGTAAGQAMKFALFGGSAAASPATLDLATIPCVDGTTGFSHVREIIALNNDLLNILKFDPTVANSQLFGMESSPAKIDVQPGAWIRFAKPLGTNGFVVDGTHHLVTLDPGANTISYAGIVLGD